MRRDHSSLFDGDAVDADDITREFWGGTRGWAAHERHHDATGGTVPQAAHLSEHPFEHPSGVHQIFRDEPTGALRAVRDGLSAFRPRTRPGHTGPVARTRRHGIVGGPTPHDLPRREATLAELAGGRARRHAHDAEHERAPFDRPDGSDDDLHDDLHDDLDDDSLEHDGYRRSGEVPLTPAEPLGARLGLDAVDPLLVRIGIVVAAVVLLLPLALALRDGDAGAVVTETSIDAPTDDPAVTLADASGAGAPSGATPAPDSTAADPAAPAAAPPAAVTVEDASPSAEAAAAPAASPESSGAAEPDRAAAAGDTGSVVVDERAAAHGDGVATVDAVAERIVPDCSRTYTAAPGDSWYRIADAAGISPTVLLSENRATVETVILPGDEICLPEGATVPSPPAPTTTAPSTTPTTTAPSAAAPTTTAPSATAGPTTTVAPVSRSEVQQIIRDIWPDELEERALEIAWRESGYVATAHNGWCCYGVFQLYWTVHRSWLDDYGILRATDLYDARKNVAAAYGLYQRSGGWGPWGG